MSSSAPELTPQAVVPEAAPGAERFAGPPGLSLRVRAARGTLVNAAFDVGLQGVGLVRGVAVAGLLSASQYGLWGLLTVTLGTLLWLAAIGLDDKYIQQDHPDQEEAFQVAFTLQALLCAVFMGLMVVAMPLFALAYDRPALLAPGLVLALAMPAIALQTPLWTLYRRMDFARQRRLGLWEPLVSLAVVVVLAAAGLGVWALVLGTLAGAWATALAALRASPYRLRLRYVPGSLREYASFSWPLFLGSGGAVLVAQVPVLLASRRLGLAAIGAIVLAGVLSTFANRVDDLVTGTLYPAICAVRDDIELLFETFSKSNRLALLWAMPVGAGIVLFTPDFVSYVIGEKWRGAVLVVQVFGGMAAINQIGFNWGAFYRARGETRPIAVVSAALLVAVMTVTVPLLLRYGLSGYAWGMAVATVVVLVVRLAYLVRLFPGLRLLGHVAHATWPTLPAIGAVLLVRALGGGRSPGRALAEALLFVAVAAGGSVVAERALLRESLGYLRGRAAAAEAV